MKVDENKFRKALEAGEQQIGLWSSLSNGFAADIISTAGFDWVLIDMEHSPNDLFSVMHQLQVYAASSTHPVVRPPSNEPVMVKRLLDMGVYSLLFPMVQNAQEAAAAVASCRYPPRGIRGVSLNHRANRFGAARDDYLKRADENIGIYVQVETRAALNELEAIAETDGVSGVFFGPADLSADFGYMGQPAHEEVVAAILSGVKILRNMGKPSGILVTDPAAANYWLRERVGFVAAGTDVALLANGARSLRSAMYSRQHSP